jgi:formyltetrahydrofolate deformylase
LGPVDAPVSAILLLSCPDQRGIVAAVADLIFRHGGSIFHAEQHIDAQGGFFFQRVEFGLDGFDLGRDEIVPAMGPILERFGMHCTLRFSDDALRTAILVSKQPHCLHDLLARWDMGELDAEVPVVISNHPDHAAVASHFGVEYVHLPVPPAEKGAQEAAVLETLARHRIDLVVLARYMQILSPGFVGRFPNRIINIHHSFLPAFAGGRPYHQAYERGVKVIGATAHYVTATLDDGPIIEQDVVRVTHRDGLDDLMRKGRDLEKVVLARAVRLHLASRVLVHGRKTIVFD